MTEETRRLAIGGVALVEARLGKINPVLMQILEEFNQWLLDDGWPGPAPFQYVSLIIRFGLKDDLEPEIGRVNKKYGELAVSIEVDTHPLLKRDMEVARQVFQRATALALLGVAQKYSIPSPILRGHCNAILNIQPSN